MGETESQRRLREKVDECTERLRPVFAEQRARRPEKMMTYTVSFDCTAETGKRIRQFIAEQPTCRRTFREYERGRGGEA